ncbi:MAG: amidohydrolase [Gammaproteobacteria bacterium]|nr:MAG: amidohydrolase [Gammaproteobacteria bacterium]
MSRWLFYVFLLTIVGCTDSKEQNNPDNETANEPFASTYQPAPSGSWVVRDAHILTGTGSELHDADLWVKDGKIQAIGKDLTVDDGTLEIDGRGRWLTPGLIDVHSHLGVYPAPETPAHADGNEMTSPVTPDVWAEHSIWPQDPQFDLARAGGVTTLQILPGSANLFGGRGVTVKNVPSLTVQGMKFPGAPYSLKMACGENPKRVYGSRKQPPSTAMGNMAGYRKAWIDAKEYQQKWKKYREAVAKGDKEAEPPKRDLAMETLVGVLEGKILVHNHCYRADEMKQMIDLAKEFGYKITAFHHAVEAYKAAPMLAKEGICAAVWADWWGFKQEAFDMVRENLAMVDAAGACGVIHSDDPVGVQHLNQEIAKAMAAGRKMGLHITKAHAIQWATLFPAKALGIDKVTGSLEVGKNADVVLWDGDPFSVYTHAEKVWIDGVLQYQRGDKPRSDFYLGLKDVSEALQ